MAHDVQHIKSFMHWNFSERSTEMDYVEIKSYNEKEDIYPLGGGCHSTHIGRGWN